MIIKQIIFEYVGFPSLKTYELEKGNQKKKIVRQNIFFFEVQ